MKLKPIIQTIALATTSFTFLTPSFAQQNPTAPVSPTERARIEEVVHQYLTQKPEVIVEALQILQRKQYEQAEQTMKKTQSSAMQYVNALFRTPNDPVAGNPNGQVTVTEFFDYQCPHCVDMAPVLDQVVKDNSNVRIVYKDFPIRGPVSELAARAALAANKQGKYLELHRALLTSNQPLTKDLIFKLAAQAGVNVEQLKKDMDSSAITQQLKANYKLAQDLKLFGTPAFFIGKTNLTVNSPSSDLNYVPGQMDQKQMQDAIDKAKS